VAGILAPIVGVIASIEAVEAIKIASGNRAAVSRNLTVVELWDNHLRQVDVSSLRDQVDCPACRRGEFPWLSGKEGSQTAVLCGRNAVQLAHTGVRVPLDELARQLKEVGRVTVNPFLLRLEVEGYELTVFPDGRAIVAGTDDVATARTVFAKYVGN
jgi:adenylyltransferase/sulfurtransferase